MTDDALSEAFRNNVALILRQRGISQNEFSRSMGFAHNHVTSRLRRGGHGIALHTVCRYAEALGVNPLALLLDVPHA